VIPFLLLALVLSAAAPGPADPVCNGASGVCVDPRFRSFYDDLNGVVFLGTPESGPVDRGRLVVQYFQRGTLELNPVNGVIRQGDTGLELVRHRLPFAAGPIPEDSPAHLYIPETGYSVSHSFKSFYLSNGGRDRFGPPISPLLNDEAPWAQYVQYFTKARLEYRPESGAPFGVEIGNVGYELYQAYLRGPQNPPPATLQYGIQVHTWYALQHREILRPAAEAGFGWVKQLVKWSQIEPAEGQFDWLEMDAFVEAAEFDGLKALVTVVEAPPWARISPLPGPPDDLEKFKTFMRALATRYAGRIQAYELWNEPNLARFWSGKVSPEGYVELLGSGYGGVKAADPQALVLFAGLAQNGAGDLSLGLDDVDFLRAAYRYREGLVKHFFDAMGEHSYGYRSPPGAEYDRWFDDSSGVYLKHPSFFFKRFEQIRAVMEAGRRRTTIPTFRSGCSSPSKTRPTSRLRPSRWSSAIIPTFRRCSCST